MNNQNNNGLDQVNNSNGQTLNPNPMATMPNNGSAVDQQPSAQPTNVSNEMPKPTLDSILNGTGMGETQPINNNQVEQGHLQNKEPIVSPVIETIPNEIPVQNTVLNNTMPIENNIEKTGVDNSLNKVEPVSPIIETIPNEITAQNVAPTTLENLNPSEPIIESIPQNPVESNVPLQNGTSIIENTPIETLEDTEPVTNNIEPQQTIETPVQQMMAQDDFQAVPVPPIFDEGKKKKKKKEKESGSKSLIIILLFILVAAIGFGVYYFLNMAKNSKTAISIITKDVKLELGENLSSEIENYATITGTDQKNCTLDLTNVDSSKVSTYKFYVTCGETKNEGTIIVDDSTKPEVVVNDLVILPDAELNPEDFIEKCVDASACTYKFAEDVTELTSKVGEYEVQIVVSDNFNNETIVTANLTVSKNAPIKYLTCTATEKNIEEIKATMVDSYKIGIDANDGFYNAVRNTEFTFNTIEDYRKIATSYDSAVGVNGITGTETLNETNKTITIKSPKTLAELNKDLNGKLPNNSNIMRAFLSGLGYTCN